MMTLSERDSPPLVVDIKTSNYLGTTILDISMPRIYFVTLLSLLEVHAFGTYPPRNALVFLNYLRPTL